jgi:hypothetical protein
MRAPFGFNLSIRQRANSEIVSNHDRIGAGFADFGLLLTKAIGTANHLHAHALGARLDLPYSRFSHSSMSFTMVIEGG